jgi:hypothetical protein
MRMAHWLGVCVIGLGLLAGCQRVAPEEPVVEPPAPPRLDEDTRARYQKLYPDAHIGRVIATLPGDRLAAVGDVPVQQFRPGDVVTFVGAEGTLVSGEVVAVMQDTLHVRYLEPAAGQRPPVVGDLAIRFKTRAQ